MTIDSGWTRILKENCPSAFLDSLPQNNLPKVVFIDGQIKLMKSNAILTWEVFYKVQFKKTIEFAFSSGADVVVLGFDNYKHVPDAKAPTQRKRSSKVQTWEFGEDEDLPPVIPDCWPMAIRNRTFKSKVIKMVCNNLRRETFVNKTLVIDWIGTPVIIGSQIKLPEVCFSQDAKRGECDIKAFNYMEMGSLLIMSTDGDYIPIALLQCAEKKGNVFLYRVKTKTNQENGVKKRKNIAVKGNSSRLEYEYVNINRLLSFVKGEFYQAKSPVDCFATLIATTGCDFTQNLPKLGPVKLWKNRKELLSIVSALQFSYSESLAISLMIIYVLNAGNSTSPSVIQKLRSALTQISMLKNDPKYFDEPVKIFQAWVLASAKSMQWPIERLFAHCKNTKWTLSYWKLLHAFPCPTEVESTGNSAYGFLLDKRGRINFEANPQQ